MVLRFRQLSCGLGPHREGAGTEVGSGVGVVGGGGGRVLAEGRVGRGGGEGVGVSQVP